MGASVLEMSEPPEGFINRTGSGVVTSMIFGAMVGAVEAMWTDAPAVKKERRGPSHMAIQSSWKNDTLLHRTSYTIVTRLIDWVVSWHFLYACQHVLHSIESCLVACRAHCRLVGETSSLAQGGET